MVASGTSCSEFRRHFNFFSNQSLAIRTEAFSDIPVGFGIDGLKIDLQEFCERENWLPFRVGGKIIDAMG